MSPEDKLLSLGYSLTKPTTPLANYVPVKRVGNTLYISGQLSAGPEGLVTGKLGGDLSVEDGQKAAALSAVNILSHIAYTAEIPLENIAGISKITVLVTATPDFAEHHLVANGASDVLVEVLGGAGRHARAAFGVASLPLNAAVEIDAIVEIAE